MFSELLLFSFLSLSLFNELLSLSSLSFPLILFLCKRWVLNQWIRRRCFRLSRIISSKPKNQSIAIISLLFLWFQFSRLQSERQSKISWSLTFESLFVSQNSHLFSAHDRKARSCLAVNFYRPFSIRNARPLLDSLLDAIWELMNLFIYFKFISGSCRSYLSRILFVSLLLWERFLFWW